MANVFWDGWRRALPDLSGDGRRWVVSPYLTGELPDLRAGDRVLTRGVAADYQRGVSTLGALEQLPAFVEIRTAPRVHAKVYVREVDGGAVGWVGSANATEGGARHNIEVMAGPFWLAADFLAQLERLWTASSRLDLGELRLEMKRLEAEERQREGVLAALDQVGPVRALKLTLRLGSNDCVIGPDWQALGGNPAWVGVRFTIPFARDAAISPHRYKSIFARFTKQLCQNLIHDGGEGVYVFHVSKMTEVMRAIHTVERELDKAFQTRSFDRDALRADFQKRFLEVFPDFAAKRLARVNVQETVAAVLSEATRRLDVYLDRRPGVEYAFFIPLPGSHDQMLEVGIRAASAAPLSLEL